MTGTERRALRVAMLIGVGALALAATGCATRVYARPAYGAVVYSAPPPRPATVVVARPAAPYAGAQWVEGHYQWNGAQYVWVDGYWVESRPGYAFVQPRWERQGGRYVYVQGGWAQGGRVVHVVGPGRPGVVVARPAPVVVARPAPARAVVVNPPGPGRVVVHGGPPPARTVVVQPQRRVVVQPRRGPAVRVVGPRGSAVVVNPR